MGKKKYLLSLCLILLVIIIYYSLPAKKVESNISADSLDINTVTKPIDKQKDPTLSKNTSKYINIDKDHLYGICGTDPKQFYLAYDSIDIESLEERQLNSINKTLAHCETWFAELALLSEQDFARLKVDYAKKTSILKELAVFKFDRKAIDKARSRIYSSDKDISFIALVYLLNQDDVFMKEIAKQMGVNNHAFLVGNTNLLTLFSCQQGEDCSTEGTLMQGLCIAREDACGLSYSAWLRSGEITLNQYDDLIRALEAINRIINSDWFIENPVIYPQNQDVAP